MILNIEGLKLAIQEGEGLKIEFKEKYTPKIDRDIVAFANSNGGLLLLGVADNGTVVGEQLTNKMKAEIHGVARNCDPQINIKSIQQIEKVVAVEIEEGEEKPYSSATGYYRRLDAVTQKMTQKEVGTLFRENHSFHFESLPCNELEMQDISLAKVKAFLQETGTSYKVDKSNLPLVLSSLGTCNKDIINNAGALMFAKNVGKHIHHAETILAAFKGTDRTHIFDRKDVRDNLLSQFNEAEAFLKKHLNIRSEIHDFTRHDIYEIPLKALREAIVNALIHRDYTFSGTSIYVMVFDDRVEIESPGSPPLGIDKKTFGKASIRRNPILADLFHRMGSVERMGSGIKRMRDLMQDAGLQKPEFEMDSFFRVIFYRNPEYSLKRAVEKTVVKTVEKTVVKILALIKDNPNITQKELVVKTGLTRRGVEWNLKKLKDEGMIERVGSARSGHWKIIEK